LENSTAEEKASGECKGKDANTASFSIFFVCEWDGRTPAGLVTATLVAPQRKNAGRMPPLPKSVYEREASGVERLRFDLLCE
jgi:hypothetical protein